MVFDSIANASISSAASNPKEFAKKKRVNRTAKIKQCKLDVRREQWLNQVKNKGCKEENKGRGRVKTPAMDMHVGNEGIVMAKLVVNDHGGEENECVMINQYSDWESPSNSPTSHTSSLTSNRSVTNFTGSSSRSSSSSSGGFGFCYSGSMTEEDDGDDGCLDDWEAIADALAADDVKNDTSEMDGNGPQLDSTTASELEPVEIVKEDQEDCRVVVNRRAWRPDDAFRPQGLPNLFKQNSLPINSDRRFCGVTAWGFKNVGFAPKTCPICCEDLDLTDSSFLPCPCGYRLCLFCYKRILEDNGRCPGCRKEYEQPDHGNATSKLARSYSMIPRH